MNCTGKTKVGNFQACQKLDHLDSDGFKLLLRNKFCAKMDVEI